MRCSMQMLCDSTCMRVRHAWCVHLILTAELPSSPYHSHTNEPTTMHVLLESYLRGSFNPDWQAPLMDATAAACASFFRGSFSHCTHTSIHCKQHIGQASCT